MRHEVDARNDSVILTDGYQTSIDCSGLRADDVMFAVMGDEQFVEYVPFNGQETDYDFSKVQAVVDAAIAERDAPPSLEEVKLMQIATINNARKDEERLGITYNGLRYSGEPSNRQALDEAIEFAQEEGLTEFATWKDSDGVFRSNHPVADVQQARLEVGRNRYALISKEGTKAGQIMNATTVKEAQAITWEL
jgi:hypothetical protein